jgi:hypothetical protein
MIYRGPGILASYNLAPPPSPLPVPRQQVYSFSPSSCVSPVELTDGRGGEEVEEEPNPTTARKPGLLYIIQYSLKKNMKYMYTGHLSNTLAECQWKICVIQLQKTSKASLQSFVIRVGYLYTMEQITIKTPNPKCRIFLKIDL